MSNLSGSFLQTPTHTDQLDTSQDSLEIDDDNASTVSELSGLSDLSGQDWKPMAGSMIWVSVCTNILRIRNENVLICFCRFSSKCRKV